MELSKGAEAVIIKKGNRIIKKRIPKSYRHQEIDYALRRFRTRREAKVLQKLKNIEFPAPALMDFSDKEMRITMQHIPGKLLKDVLNINHKRFALEIGKKVAMLHKHDIIHGDLTTSNMIVADEIYFIDFGLSKFSKKIEDKAVDLHLLCRALHSKHHQIAEECFLNVLKGYKRYDKHKSVLERLKKVSSRGRYKRRSQT